MPVATSTRRLEALARSDAPHLDAPYGTHLVENSAYGLELPYSSLKGPGFERLCFHLLLADGKRPRFFGESGHAQFGIDLIVSDGKRCEVFQCKNVAGYNESNLKSDLQKFEREWLEGHPDLIRPKQFTLCVPERLTGRDKWEEEKTAFVERTEITVEEWDRNTLDILLKRQPDIVSDLFGDDVAERFCDRDNWNDGRFRPLLQNCGDKGVERFLDLLKDDRLAIAEDTTEKYKDILALGSVGLIEGGSGVGKTMAALALSAATGRRVFFVRIDESIDENALFEGVKERCVRETTFVIDDCQHNWSIVEGAVDRWAGALRGRDYKLVLTAQTAPTGAESYNLGEIELVNELRNDGATIEIVADEPQFKSVLAKRGESWAKASDKQIRHLHALAAGNLAVLDLIIESGVDVRPGDKTIEDIASRLVSHWFGTASPSAPRIQAFAAVAQFDIAIRADATWPQAEESAYPKAVRRLICRFGDHIRGIAPSWRFFHPAEAETIFRALTVVAVEKDWRAVTMQCVINHFLCAATEELKFVPDLELFLRSHLRLADDTEIKVKVLAAEEFQDALRPRLLLCPLSILSRMAFMTREIGKGAPYSAWLVTRLKSVAAEPARATMLDFASFGGALRTVHSIDRSMLLEFETLAFALMLRLICRRGTIVTLFKSLERTTPSFAAGLIAALNADIVATLIDKTIAAERSIGTLNLAFRELGDRPMAEGDGRSQLEALEGLIGGAPMLRLICARGTILELLKILEHTTPSFAAGLIGALNADIVATLIDTTIAAERSIGTLNFALRELGDRPMPEGDGRSQLEALQGFIGGAPMLRLICARGTIFELLMILKHTTPSFAAGLIGALNADIVAALIDKTIAAERSIGTLDLALKELGDRPLPEGDGRSQLEALQGLIGGAPMLRLICARGTIFELFRILQRTTPSFAAGLIGALNADIIATLIDKTIAAERSIGTLSFTLRELSDRPMPAGDGRSQLEALEAIIGATGFWRLVEGAGDLKDLSYLLDDLTAAFRMLAAAEAHAPDMSRWQLLMRRGNYFCLARFAKDSIRFLPAIVFDSFKEAALQEVKGLANTSPWSQLAHGLALCEKIEAVPTRELLESAALARIERTDLSTEQFGDFIEVASGLRLIWRHREALRAEIGCRLWQLFPPRREWPEDHQLLIGGKLILEIGCNALVGRESAARLMQAFTPKLPAEAFSKSGAHVLYLFIWNLGACWAFWHGQRPEALLEIWDAPTQDRIFERLGSLVREVRTNKDKLNVFALAGVLAYIAPETTTRLASMLKGNITGFRWLIEEAEEMSFVPAALASIGLSLIGPPRIAFSGSRLKRIIAKAAEYEERGPAIEHLISYLRRVSRPDHIRR